MLCGIQMKTLRKKKFQAGMLSVYSVLLKVLA